MLKNQNNNKFLDYLSVIKFVVENVYKVKSVDEVTSWFQNSVEDITDRDELHIAQLKAMNIPGHENYLFRFKESESFFGEFSLDFIPLYPEEFARNEIRKLGGLSKIPLYSQKQLANFRIQLFADGLLSSAKLGWKNKAITDYITNQFGKPNQSPITIEQSKILTETYGTKIDCWNFQKEDRDYLITFYFFRGNEVRSYISFSISLVFNNKV